MIVRSTAYPALFLAPIIGIIFAFTALHAPGNALAASPLDRLVAPTAAVHVSAQQFASLSANAACDSVSDAQNLIDDLSHFGIHINEDPGTVAWMLQYAANGCGCITDLRPPFDELYHAWDDCGGAFSTIIFLIRQYTNPPSVS